MRTFPPTYIVGGWPRTGTSLMMAVLEEGGIPALYDRKLVDAVSERDEESLEKRGEYGTPYPMGGREMPRKVKWHNKKTGAFKVGDLAMARQELQRELPGTCIKIVNQFVRDYPTLKPAKVIYMLRPWEEARASALKTFTNRDPDFMVYPSSQKYDDGNDWYINHWKMQPGAEVMQVQYHTLLRDPLDQCRRIDEFLRFDGFDVEKAAAVVDPRWYRHRKGDNC